MGADQRIGRGGDSSVDDLQGAIYDYLLQHNAKPKLFVWSKVAEDIITRERRALDALGHTPHQGKPVPSILIVKLVHELVPSTFFGKS